MFDDFASALTYVLGLIVAWAQGITREDLEALAISFAVAASVLIVREIIPMLAGWSIARVVRGVRQYVDDLYTTYARRFTARGFTFQTCDYSLKTGFVLWFAAFLVLGLWPSWEVLGIIALSTLAVVLTLSVLGFNARGDSRPGIWRFGIFYEPSFALVSTFVVGKLPELAGRGLTKLATFVAALIA